MQAVAFASLFLGLTLGQQPVTLVVGEGVAGVELLLDGEAVGELREPPWTLPIDLGAALAPHELVAVARDADGEEVGRASQWINLPRAPAEVEVVLAEGEGGRGAVAILAWESVLGREPRSVTATFDGAPLDTTDPRRLALPPHDPDRLHLLRVEIEFSANLGAVTEVVFGGDYGSRTATELTGVPVTLDRGRATPSPAEMAGWFQAAGRPVNPVAVEEGPAQVVVVMDRRAQESLRQLARAWHQGSLRGEGSFSERAIAGHRRGSGGRHYSPPRHDLRLGEGQVLRFLWPFSRGGGHEHVRYALFARSEDHPPEHGGLLWLLTAAQQPAFSLDEQRLADAVAVAGMSAAARGRRRAVLLVLSDAPADASQLSAATVRGYLSRLGVPLVVWATGEVTEQMEGDWGDVRSIRREHWLRAAVSHLSQSLERQRIVWLAGLHLPQQVVTTASAEGIQRVR